MTLNWKGDQVVAKVERAATAGRRETVEAAMAEARPITPVDTGRTRDSLRAEDDGNRTRWGYHTRWGIFVEIGSRGRAGAHALRRSADHQYGQLVGRIARRLGA